MLNGSTLIKRHPCVVIRNGYEVVSHNGVRIGLYLQKTVAEHFASFRDRKLIKRVLVVESGKSEDNRQVFSAVSIDNRQSLTLIGVHEYSEINHLDYIGVADITIGYELVGDNGHMKWRLGIFKHQDDAEREEVRHHGSSVRERVVMEVGEWGSKNLYILDAPIKMELKGTQLELRFARVGNVSSTFIRSLAKVG